MLVNLDNEVHFKNVFTDVEIFRAFVKDVLGIDMNINKVETEKTLRDSVGAIKFRMDLFAEDEVNRTIVEIQKVDYDYNIDRFNHYFMANLIDLQRSSSDYAYAKEVYVIIVVTSAYKVSRKNGELIKDDVLVIDFNPRTLREDIRKLYNHKLVILNTTNTTPDTPQEIKDWLDLIMESIRHPENPNINLDKPAIAKAARMAELKNVDPEQLADAKIMEMKRKMVALKIDEGREEGIEIGVEKERKEAELKQKKKIENALKQGKFSKSDIAELFDVTLEYVEEVERNMEE